MYRKFLKRLLDILLSGLALIVLSPLLLVLAVLVRVKLGSPVLFTQERPGKDEKIFKLYKFRTMTDQRDEAGNLQPDSERLTKFGRMLRATSLDELPELWNIFKGEMSIVGPRPQLIRDMVFFTPEQRRRQCVRPGLTGLAQIEGRNAIDWEKKLEIDLGYLERITFWNDLRIVLITAKKILIHEPDNQEQVDLVEDLGDNLLHRGVITEEEYWAGQQAANHILPGAGKRV